MDYKKYAASVETFLQRIVIMIPTESFGLQFFFSQ